jgi:putative spermidine/putrescine transport system permease protein
MTRENRWTLWMILLPGLFLAIFFLGPLLWMVTQSFYTPQPLRPAVPDFTLTNYGRLVDPFYIIGVVGRTVAMGALGTLGALLLGYPVAYYLARSVSAKWRGILLALIVTPLWVSMVIRAFGFRELLADSGLINRAFLAMGIIDSPFRFIGSDSGVVLTLMQISVPYVVMALFGTLLAIPNGAVESAQTLGASQRIVFQRIILPLSMPGLIAAAVIVFALNVSAFSVPLLLGGGRSRMLAPVVFEHATVTGNLPFAAALGVSLLLLVSLVMTVYSLARRRFHGQRATIGAQG